MALSTNQVEPVLVLSSSQILGRSLALALVANGLDAESRRLTGELPTRHGPLVTIVTCDSDINHLEVLTGGQAYWVALVFNQASHHCRRLLDLGASHILGEDSSFTEIVHCAANSLESSQVSISRDLLFSLISSEPVSSAVPTCMSSEEAKWINAIASGRTISQIAISTNISERELHRRLSRLYARLGAKTRMEAIAIAHRIGAIRDPLSQT